MTERHTMAKDRPGRSQYPGDGVYVVHDGYGMWLTAEDGVSATDAIYIEPNVWESLKQFVRALKNEGEEACLECGRPHPDGHCLAAPE